MLRHAPIGTWSNKALGERLDARGRRISSHQNVQVTRPHHHHTAMPYNSEGKNDTPAWLESTMEWQSTATTTANNDARKPMTPNALGLRLTALKIPISWSMATSASMRTPDVRSVRVSTQMILLGHCISSMKLAPDICRKGARFYREGLISLRKSSLLQRYAELGAVCGFRQCPGK